jgi:hypothetical protein
MKLIYIIPLLVLLTITSCINLEEEPILIVRPTVKISAHIKNERISATAQINVNPDVLVTGNLDIHFEYSGDLAIYNTRTGNVIDFIAFSGGGQSRVFTVEADTASHESLVVIASGKIEAWADVGNDGEAGNDKLLSDGGFHEEAVYYLSPGQPLSSDSPE